MQMDDALSLVTNVGFPAGLCFILLRHILHTMEEKLDKLDLSLHELIQVIQDLNVNNSPSSKSSKPVMNNAHKKAPRGDYSPLEPLCSAIINVMIIG
ncbi:hypothetical protein QD46_17345 [Paenibacillus polymyxa]|uniref:YvrJ family protein n=1 Tax=Paenibacillus polymyxa TaxID=1406 RepID=UPI0005E2829E|nr:YvrJ family protein [Paenibacillus polymyxa]KJD38775.1 hypothetical protein QD46_17345 [Paenibacillus polymyxa]